MCIFMNVSMYIFSVHICMCLYVIYFFTKIIISCHGDIVFKFKFHTQLIKRQ